MLYHIIKSEDGKKNKNTDFITNENIFEESLCMVFYLFI
jgi:hypothetical protein